MDSVFFSTQRANDFLRAKCALKDFDFLVELVKESLVPFLIYTLKLTQRLKEICHFQIKLTPEKKM